MAAEHDGFYKSSRRRRRHPLPGPVHARAAASHRVHRVHGPVLSARPPTVDVASSSVRPSSSIPVRPATRPSRRLLPGRKRNRRTLSVDFFAQTNGLLFPNVIRRPAGHLRSDGGRTSSRHFHCFPIKRLFDLAENSGQSNEKRRGRDRGTWPSGNFPGSDRKLWM